MYSAIFRKRAGLALRAKSAIVACSPSRSPHGGVARFAQVAAAEGVVPKDAPVNSATTSPPSPAGSVPFRAVLESQEFWRHVPIWQDASADNFLSYRWGVANTVQGGPKLHKFLSAVLPSEVPLDRESGTTQTRDELINDVFGTCFRPDTGGVRQQG